MSLFTDIKLPTGETYKQPIGLFINNEFVKSHSDELIETINPTNGELITSVYAANEQDIDIAVKAAREAYETKWSKTSGVERGELLYRLAELIEQERDILAKIDSLDAGKPYESNSQSDLSQIIELTKYFAGYSDKIKGSYLPISDEKFVYEIKEPYGVVGQIVPWNYPLAMASWKIQSALAAGNTIVIKSAENTPLSLLYFGQLIVKAGFPPGVVNIISGLGSIAGSAIASHEDVDKIAFTGSTQVGKHIQQAATSNLKAVTLECGGKSPSVVFKDSNLSNAAKWSALGIFYNTGQNCTANSRILVEEEVYDEFLTLFQEEIKKNWIVGDPFDDKTTVGPLISKVQLDRVQSYIKHGEEVEKLSKLEVGDSAIYKEQKGWFQNPIIFKDVPTDSKLFQEEIFGPVVTITKFSGFEDGLTKANNTKYGLGSAVFTNNIQKAHKFGRGLKAGTVWINSSNDEDIRASFGGYKLSGIGRELGESGIEVYTQTKAIHVNLSEE
ncbi:Retinal dehydrogenase [Wickerhamomyces ciferrii]|uniref:Retinal dehydrogenase n=1 Tax=Wickerhamomyces ciferrii (strain ATCC 14091 / BCRC 22168 / CBS 111 / JCM 3599 / NBRC 0793 / NRRL Y-1031 F-60-10) TaxID=1206466 RepID=K0KU15_WICCF|nr:Retinal dehydrogenase [Wickerhamomyces ciferrii]CCH44899.1 Retinal dehydrogenase [Wickerhamomyces ciferrii]